MIFRSEKNTLRCYGTIWNGDGINFMYEFERLQQSYSEVTLKLHTYGGSVFDGNLMYNAINKAKAKVTIEIEGLAASMGAFLLMATPDVKIVENGFIMIHAPRSGSSGTSSELKKRAKLLDKMQENFVSKLQERTGLTAAKAKAYMDGDNWIDAKEALALGIVTEIIEVVTTPKIGLDEPSSLGELEVYNAYASLISKQVNNPKHNTTMKQLLITAFALAAVTAESSDTAVMEALQEKFNGLKQGKDTAEASLAKAEKKLNDFKENQVSQLVEAYAKENKLSEDKKNVFMNIGKTSGIEALQAVLENTKPTSQSPGIGNMIQNGKPGDGARADWDWDKWQKEDPRGLEALAENNMEAWEELFNQKYNK